MNSLFRRLGAALLIGLGGCGFAAAATVWTVVPETSSLSFSGRAQGEIFSGEFHRFDARIAFDPADLAGSHFEVSIDLASADTVNAERDELLLGEEFLAAGSNAKAEYRADKFESQGHKRYRALGVLTLKGASRPVTLDFHWDTDEDGAQMGAEAELDRLAFGIGTGEWADPEMIDTLVRVVAVLKLVATPP